MCVRFCDLHNLQEKLVCFIHLQYLHLVAGAKQRWLASSEGRAGIHTSENQSVEGCVQASLEALVEGLCSWHNFYRCFRIFVPSSFFLSEPYDRQIVFRTIGTESASSESILQSTQVRLKFYQGTVMIRAITIIVYLYDMTPPHCMTRSQVLHYTIEELLPGAILVAFVVFLSSFAGAKKFAMKAGKKKDRWTGYDTIRATCAMFSWSDWAVMQWTNNRCCVCLCRVVKLSDRFHPPGLPQRIYNTTVTPRFHVFLLSTAGQSTTLLTCDLVEIVSDSIGLHVRTVISWVIYPTKVI